MLSGRVYSQAVHERSVKAPFLDLKAGHVDHLLSYIYQRIIYWTIFLEN